MHKLHESVIGTRFISAGYNITAAFKLLYKSIEKCHIESKFYVGINWFLVIQKRKPVFDTLHKLVTEKPPSLSQYMIFHRNITTHRLQTN